MALQNSKASYSESFTDLTDGNVYTSDVEDLARDEFGNTPANYLIIFNGGNQKLIASLDGVEYPLPANNGILSIKRDDLIRFSSLTISNESGVNMTGTVNLVYGWLYQAIVGSLDLIDPKFI